MEIEQRKDGFDIAKAIAIWMVVIGHLYSNIQNDTINIIQFSHMPIFFFISGYFLWTSTQKYSLPVLCLKKSKKFVSSIFAWSMVSFAANLLMMFIKYGGVY